MWSLVWGQFSEVIKTKWIEFTTYETHEATVDCAWLLKKIRNVCHQTESTTHPYITSLRLRKQLCDYKERSYQTLLDYTQELQAIAKTIKSAGEGIGLTVTSPVLDEVISIYKKKQNLPRFDRLNVTDRSVFAVWPNNQHLAMIFIANVDKKKYGEFTTKLYNDYLLGNNNYPGTFTDAFSLFLNFESTGKVFTRSKPIPGRDDDQQEMVPGVNFAQKSK